MSATVKVLYGFHAVGVRLKTAPSSILELYVDPSRRDARMRQFVEKAQEAQVRLIEADGVRFDAGVTATIRPSARRVRLLL